MSTLALGDPTRPSVHQHVSPKPFAKRHSSCDSIIADCVNSVNTLFPIPDDYNKESLYSYQSNIAFLLCGTCFDENESYHRCTGNRFLAEEFRYANCARSDVDGKYCLESFYNGIANENIPTCNGHVCVATCYNLRNLRNYLGCCTTSFV